jgi:hypothetical protein
MIGRADGWKACAFNDRPIGCRDTHSPNGTVRVVWEDGKAMTYHLENKASCPALEDSLGGAWVRQIFVQGNAVFTNGANGNRLFMPLRPETNRP